MHVYYVAYYTMFLWICIINIAYIAIEILLVTNSRRNHAGPFLQLNEIVSTDKRFILYLISMLLYWINRLSSRALYMNL